MVTLPTNIDEITPDILFQGMDITPETREDYVFRIESFVNFVKENGFHTNSFLAYKDHLREQSLKTSTKNKYMAAARIFLREAYKRALIPRDITVNVKGFKASKKHKKFGHTEDEIKKVLEYLKGLNLRDRAILSLLIYHGLRQIEVLRLRAEDFNFDNKVMYIQGKGQDDRDTVIMHDSIIPDLQMYVRLAPKSGPVFKVSDRTIRNIHSRMMDALDIKGRTTHGLRHFFSTKIIKALDGNLAEAAKYTRHANLETLQIYNDDVNTEESNKIFQEAFKF